MNIQIFN